MPCAPARPKRFRSGPKRLSRPFALEQLDKSGSGDRQDPPAAGREKKPCMQQRGVDQGNRDHVAGSDVGFPGRPKLKADAAIHAGERSHGLDGIRDQAGIEMGNSARSISPYVIGHAVMRDSIDLAAVVDALGSVGLTAAEAQNGRLVNIFAKAEASPDGSVRGFRHTMLDDSDVGSTRHARAAVGGLVAGLSGTGAVYVSGGAEHQGPPGGGPVAAIARV